MIFFTGDLHIGGNRRAHDDYGLRSYAEFAEIFIPRWNTKVKPHDTVYILGDICKYYDSRHMRALIIETLNSLNGHKILVPSLEDPPYLDLIYHYTNMERKESIIKFENVVLCHYPILKWEDINKGVLHFHAHLHGFGAYQDGYNRMKHCVDVGLPATKDLRNEMRLAPLSLKEATYLAEKNR